MNKHPTSASDPPGEPLHVDQVTRERVHLRAHELAQIASRGTFQVSLTDYKQAKDDILNGWSRDQQTSVSVSIGESENWNPVSCSIGQQTPEYPLEIEDTEGRSESGQLMDDGAQTLRNKLPARSST